MSDAAEDKPTKTPVEQAEDTSDSPVQPDPANMLREVMQTVQERANKPVNKDAFDSHPGGTAARSQESDALQKLFNGNKKDGAQQQALEKLLGQGILQPIDLTDSGDADKGGKKAPETAQFINKDGKVTTLLDSSNADKSKRDSNVASLEYDPKTGKYQKIDQSGKPIGEAQDGDKIGPNGETFKELREKGIKGKDKDGNETVTHLDGRVTTKFEKPQANGVTESTSFPPGYRHENPADQGLRQLDKIPGQDPKDSTANADRTVKHFENRKETTFAQGDIKSITAFKNPEKGQPAVVTEYKDGKGPDGSSKIEKYKQDDKQNPEKIDKVAHFPDGKQKITYTDGKPEKIVDAPQPGEHRAKVGGEKNGILDVNDKGMPTRMQIGDKDYKVEYDDKGKVKSLSVESKTPPGSKVEFETDATTGKLKLKGEPPADGKLNLDGIPLNIDKDGNVVGDLQLSKTGAIKYKTGDGPDRMEYVRRPDGSTSEYNFKNWTRTTTDANGKVSNHAWDGKEWRSYDTEKSKDGTIIFNDGAKDKPKAIQRDISGQPPSDKTTIINPDGSKVDCDWQKGVQQEFDKDGKPGKTYHYDGATFREGRELKREELENDPRFKDLLKENEKGKVDKIVAFTDGKQPAVSLKRSKESADKSKPAESTITSVHLDAKGDVSSTVERNSKGQVTDVVSADKSRKSYEYDQDGDLSKISEFDNTGKLSKTMSRKGPEQDPGMQSWLGRDSAGRPVRPGDEPPRNLNEPKGFNTWEIADGEGKVTGTERANINTTGDGTERKEVPDEQGKLKEVQFRDPGGDRYKDVGNQRFIEKTNGIKEVQDLSKNPPESVSVEFERNGQKVKLEAKDGPYTIGRDGTVKQFSKDGKSATTYMTDGSQLKSTIEQVPATEKDKPPTSKETITELKLADPSKPGSFIEMKAPEAKSITQDPRTGRITVAKEGVTETYDTNKKTVSKQKAGEEFARVENYADGNKVVRIDGKAGPIARVNGDKIERLDSRGQAVATLDGKKWDLSKGSVNKDGDLVLPAQPPGDSSAVVKANGAVYEMKGDSLLKASYPNKSEATFDKNGKPQSIKVGDKEYKAEYDASGKIKELKAADGSKLEIPAGKFDKLDDDGNFVSESEDKDNKSRAKETWNPIDGSTRVTRSWDGKDLAGQNKTGEYSYTLAKDGKTVTKFSLGGGELSVSELHRSHPSLQASVDSTGTLTVKVDAGHTIVMKPDGSRQDTMTKPGLPQISTGFDRNGNIQIGDSLKKGFDEILSKSALATGDAQKAAQKELLDFLLNHTLAGNNSPEIIKKQLDTIQNYLNQALGEAGRVELKVDAAGKRNLTVTMKGKSPFSVSA